MTTLSVCFTNFGPYHRARLRALAEGLARSGDRLLAIEVADQERRYPWARSEDRGAFDTLTLFPGRALESLAGDECRRAMVAALDSHRPDVLGIVGYARPESMAALNWARRAGRRTILMSESQEIDHPRTWWKEAIKRHRVRRFDAGLVGGPRHRDYLVKLGMPRHRITLGYNAVDNDAFAARADAARADPTSRRGLPAAPYFVAVNRFVPEKNLDRLVRAYARYRADAPAEATWDLALCGGGPEEGAIDGLIRSLGLSGVVHRPGFLQADRLAPWLAHASAFVHPSLMEPWGLVANEAAAAGLPLLISDRAGCVETLVPHAGRPFDRGFLSGRRFDPRDEVGLADALAWIASFPENDRRAMGDQARRIVAEWGPARFASGAIEALRLARGERRTAVRGLTAHRQLLQPQSGETP